MKWGGILNSLIVAGLVGWGTSAAGLTADELIQLKQAGLSEAIIALMAESNYPDVAKVLKLKQAGFQDETILAVIRGDLTHQGGLSSSRGAPAPPGPASPLEPPVLCQSQADVEILWRFLYYGDRIQNQDRHADATLTVRKGTLEVTWAPSKSIFSVLHREPFPPPFLWELDPEDALYRTDDPRFPYALISTPQHRGKPPTDGKHYWILRFKPEDGRMVQCLLNLLSSPP